MSRLHTLCDVLLFLLLQLICLTSCLCPVDVTCYIFITCFSLSYSGLYLCMYVNCLCVLIQFLFFWLSCIYKHYRNLNFLCRIQICVLSLDKLKRYWYWIVINNYPKTFKNFGIHHSAQLNMRIYNCPLYCDCQAVVAHKRGIALTY